ncbi:hypothetical protein MAR_029555 [Mya arenaria]|uniref:Protein sleepless n=1 Tax=Mya arenaria TaxID=6604 RepID=A0ABY7DKJ8_MYAAR|nr:uncharacterized protein LOC128212434 [Mya arenaria]WAQ96865.1 hypothetical protein MAR_029555 [Mya arenaria]
MRTRPRPYQNLHSDLHREQFSIYKMKWLIASMVGAVAIFLVLDSVVAQKPIRCFVCNSYFQKTCADWFNNGSYNQEPCDPGVTMCRKIVQEVYYDDQWNTRYIRQCAPSGEVGGDQGRECVERTGTYRVKMRYCHCDNQDGCNGAESVKIPMIAMLLPALTTLGLLFRKL